MQGASNRSIVVISGLLTLLLLGGTTLAVAFHRGWLRTASDAGAPDAVSLRAQSTDSRNTNVAPAAVSESPSAGSTETSAQDQAAVYRQKLDEAYRALDDAYAQIRVLQTPQTRLASVGDRGERFGGHGGDDDHRELRPRRRNSDDH